MKKIFIILSAMWIAGQTLAGDAKNTSRTENKALVKELYEEQVKQFGSNPDKLVLPGLLADRKQKQVLIQAEATGLGADEIVEFFLIAENSGRDYESLAVAFAKPANIHKAIEFIGMAPGRPANSRKLMFRPKGERVILSFAVVTPEGQKAPIRAERLVFSDQTQGPLPEAGLVFTGSAMIPDPESSGNLVYAADLGEPGSIASTYNEPTSVFDVPRSAPQSTVYSHISVHPGHVVPSGARLEVLITPEYDDGRKRVADLLLEAKSTSDKISGSVREMYFNLEETGSKGSPILQRASLNEMLKAFTKLLDQGRDPFVRFSPGKNLSLGSIRELCAILSSIETDQGITVEPPESGHLYYRAFLPPEAHRRREDRLSQPWELQVFKKNDGLAGTLTYIEEVWHPDKVQPDLKTEDIPVTSSGQLQKALQSRESGMAVILIFADPSLPYGMFMDFLRPSLATHPTLHVFTDGAPPPAP